MPIPKAAGELLNREFLAIRARLIDAAAMLDRIDRGEGSAEADPRLAKIRQAAEILAEAAPDRAKRILSLFSLPYEDAWRKEFGL